MQKLPSYSLSVPSSPDGNTSGGRRFLGENKAQPKKGSLQDKRGGDHIARAFWALAVICAISCDAEYRTQLGKEMEPLPPQNLLQLL